MVDQARVRAGDTRRQARFFADSFDDLVVSGASGRRQAHGLACGNDLHIDANALLRCLMPRSAR